MRTLIKISLFLIYFIFCSINASAKDSSKPDFAYPKQVVQQAENNINKALKNSDGNAVVKSLIEYSIAQSLINTDSTQTIINKIEQVTNKEKNPCTKALLNTLLIDLYTNIYTQNKYIYNQRTNVSNITSLDISQWSRKDFEQKVFSLYDEALKDSETLKKSKLNNYSDIITHNNLTFTYYPTLYDFIVYRLISNIAVFSGNNIYPTEILPLNLFITLPINSNNPYFNRIYSLYQEILSFHQNDIAPLIHWDIERISSSYNDYPIMPRESNEDSDLVQKHRALQYLYNTYEHSEYASLVLIHLWDKNLYQQLNISNIVAFHTLLNKRLDQFPAFSGNCKIKNIINEIERQRISLNFNHQIIPNDTLSIILSNDNCKSLRVEILRLPEDINTKGYSLKKGASPQVYKSFDLTYKNNIPFSINDTLKITISQPGYYTVIAYNDDIEKNLNNLDILYCSVCTSISSNQFDDDYRIWVLNAKSGKVINNANINIFRNANQTATNNPLFSAKSTRDGKIKFNGKNHGQYYYSIVNGEDKYSPQNYFYIQNPQTDTTWIDRANCFTSLPLYHPGDTVAWSAVVYSYKNDISKLASNKSYTISFRDANYMQIDTAIVTTDNFGRIEGKFIIPTNRLSGNYSINVIGKFNRNVAYSSFMVSDYKLPTFDIKITDISKQENGNYIIDGEVRSFSGFALNDATINLNLLAREYQFYNTIPFTSILNDSTTTDANGKFSISITSPIINNWKKILYNAEITAISSTGESQSTNKIFSNGNSFYIAPFMLGAYPIEATQNTKLNVTLHSISGNAIDGMIYYSIVNDSDKIIKNGSFSSSNPIVDWSNIKSGEYKIKLYSIAPTTTDTVSEYIKLYRISDAMPPVNEGIWLQHNEYTITKDNSVEFYYGSTFNDGEILYLLYDNKKIYDQRWIKVKAGIHKSRILLPKNLNEANIKLITINNYNSYSVNASVNRVNTDNYIKINAQSFRDKITPGSEEKWTFNISDTNGNGKESAIIMSMYSMAIEKIKPHDFNLKFYRPSRYSDISLPHFFKNSSNGYSKLLNAHQCTEINKPQFNTYGKLLIGDNHYSYSSMIRANSSNISTQSLIRKETGAAVEESVNRDNLYEMAATKKLNYTAPSTTEDTPTINIPLRENESPLAFFRPMLTTDTLGNLIFSFTAPNVNTTWLFNALAFNKDMKVAQFAREVLSNKPIMVQPNMPRFLRQGDKATIKASVMNNSDSLTTINTIIELFDPTTNKTIDSSQQTDIIEAHQSTIASIVVTAPNDATMIGYRIKSFCDNFGDGEQTLIPILPATSPVIESTTFYMGADEKSTTIQLPSMPEKAHVTLEFCENPTWYAVTALPGLTQNQSRTSISAAMAIYSTAIADGIIRQMPQVTNALYEWQHSDKNDSTLVSMLSRNEDLKNMLLCTTPWVQNAENDTERMARLSLLFDKKEIKANINKNVNILATLQRNSGGWAWIAENEKASPWATLSILEKIGHLKRLGYLPKNKDLNSMIENAVKYIDAEFVQQFKKHPDGNYCQYVLIRNMFSEYRQSTAAQRVTNATIQQIINNWKTYDLGEKAVAAMILNNNGYSSTALKILSSIGQFAQSTPSKGMWWPSIVNSLDNNINKNLVHANILDAYHQINPSNKNIDLIRQWLIINKEANNWGNSTTTSYVIYTLLNTGSPWTKPAVGCEISLNGEQITPSHFETITGYLRTDISNLSPSNKKLIIGKHGALPAWGAIYRQYDATMTEINAVAGNDISINKTIFKQVGGSWLPTDTFAVGDRVRIQLTIISYRDIEYVSISDERAACFEPIEQLPKPIFAEGIRFYRENRDEATNIFVSHLPKGTYLLNYDMYANNEGEYSSGIATIQSQYAPQITAHSAGNLLNISAQ